MTDTKELSSKKHKRNLTIAGVVVGMLIAAVFIVMKRKGSLEIVYREIPVTKRSIEVTILGTGTVSPENRVEIKPPVAGRVEKVIAKEGQKVKKGEILAWMSSTERAALLDAARAQGSEEVKKWEDNYKPTPILAPINGTIILRNVESGQTFTNTDSVFAMSDRLTVKAQVDETDISAIHLNQRAKLILDAYPKQTIEAHVDQIAFDAKTVNNVTTYIVDVLPDETPEFMRSGMTANVTFLVTSKEDVLTIASDALHVKDNNKYFVLLKQPNGQTTQERPVEIGITDGKKTEIVSGLAEGDIVLAAEIKSNASGGSNRPSNPFSPLSNRRGGH